MDGGGSVVLAQRGPNEQGRTEAAESKAYSDKGEERERRVAGDERVGPEAVAGGDGGEVLPNEVGKRGVLSELQVYTEEGEVVGQNGGGGASRGAGVDAGHAVADDAGVGSRRGDGESEDGDQRAAVADPGEARDGRGAERERAARVPGQGGMLPTRTARTNQPEAETNLVRAAGAEGDKTPEDPRDVRRL